MENKEILELRKKWYSQTFVQFEIIKCLKHKVVTFLDKETNKKNIRYLFMINIDYMKKHFEHLDFLKYNANFYHSVADLKDIPIFTYNLIKRKETEEYKEFNINYENYCIGYDFFIDIDGKENFEKAYENAKALKKIFDSYELPYYILNSSFNGFHFIIDSKYIEHNNIKLLVNTLRQVIWNIKKIYDLEYIDHSITDIKRIRKTPYCFVNDGSIVLPLSNEQFENFNKDLVKCENVMKNIKIKNRGLLTRNLDNGVVDPYTKVRKFIIDHA